MTQSELRPVDPETARMIVSNPMRQELVQQLTPDEPVTVSELADQLDKSNRDESAPSQVKIELVHDHLPRLDDHGVVAYEPDSNEVVLEAELDGNLADVLLEPLVDLS